MNPPTPTQEEMKLAADSWCQNKWPKQDLEMLKYSDSHIGFLSGIRWLQEWNEKHATAYKPDLIRDSVFMNPENKTKTCAWHTPDGIKYLSWVREQERRDTKTHEQLQCEVCRFWFLPDEFGNPPMEYALQKIYAGIEG